MAHTDVIDRRIRSLERRLRTTQVLLGAFMLGAAGVMMGALQDAQPADEIRTRRLVVVDDAGVTRVVIGQDPVDTQRRSRAAGITIHDRHGHERGGMSTFDDDSVVLALDAPVGVGSPMRDRVAMSVYPNGAADVMVIDNQTRAVAKLASDAEGNGGPMLFKWDMEAMQMHVKTLTFDGERVETIKLGDG